MHDKTRAKANRSPLLFADDEQDDKHVNCKTLSNQKVNGARKTNLNQNLDDEQPVEEGGENARVEAMFPFLIDVEGSISNINEIESDKRRQSLKIVRNELNRNLSGKHKKQVQAI